MQTFDAPDGQLEQAFKALCALIFLALFIDSLSRKSYAAPLNDIRKQGGLLMAGLKHVKRAGYVVAAAALVMLAIPAITMRVGPGQQGMIMRFGAVVEQALDPGLYLRFPWPIDTTRLVNTAEVRDTYIASSTREFLTSDENIIALTSVIQYRIDDSYAFEFRGEKSVDLLRDLASRILVQEILSRPIDEIYTVERFAVEKAYRTRLAKEVAALDQGFELVEARLEHVHAPEGVHDSFRDVSSALEDRQRATYEADGEAIALVTNAKRSLRGGRDRRGRRSQRARADRQRTGGLVLAASRDLSRAAGNRPDQDATRSHRAELHWAPQVSEHRARKSGSRSVDRPAAGRRHQV